MGKSGGGKGGSDTPNYPYHNVQDPGNATEINNEMTSLYGQENPYVGQGNQMGNSQWVQSTSAQPGLGGQSYQGVSNNELYWMQYDASHPGTNDALWGTEGQMGQQIQNQSAQASQSYDQIRNEMLGQYSEQQQRSNVLNQAGDYLLGSGTNMLSQAQGQYNQLQQPGRGLFDSQQAYINQAVSSGQDAVSQQLASMGLSSSTQNAMLRNEVSQAGAAQAGQLIQGNLQLAQNQEKTAIGEQGMGIAEQGLGLQSMQQEQSNLGLQSTNESERQAALQGYDKLYAAEQSIGLAQQGLQYSEMQQTQQAAQSQQQALYQEAIQGYQVENNIMQSTLAPYGMADQWNRTQVQANAATVQGQVETDRTNEQAWAQSQQSSQSSSSGGGGGLSGILGSLGGSIGGMVGGSSGSSTGSQIGSIVGSVVSIVASLWCWVAREVFGEDDLRWKQFRHWVLFYAPPWFRRMYGQHGRAFALWIHDKPWLKSVIRWFMISRINSMKRKGLLPEIL
jgi:hypothetical protein